MVNFEPWLVDLHCAFPFSWHVAKEPHHGVGVLAHEPEQVDELPDDLVVGLGRGVVLLGTLLGVRHRRDEGNVHVQVVGVLDGPDNLRKNQN